MNDTCNDKDLTSWRRPMLTRADVATFEARLRALDRSAVEAGRLEQLKRDVGCYEFKGRGRAADVADYDHEAAFDRHVKALFPDVDDAVDRLLEDPTDAAIDAFDALPGPALYVAWCRVARTAAPYVATSACEQADGHDPTPLPDWFTRFYRRHIKRLMHELKP